MVRSSESQDQGNTKSDCKQVLRKQLLNEVCGQMTEMRKLLLEELRPPQGLKSSLPQLLCSPLEVGPVTGSLSPSLREMLDQLDTSHPPGLDGMIRAAQYACSAIRVGICIGSAQKASRL